MFSSNNSQAQDHSELNRYLSPISVWALAFGCAVGWGAFVMPGTTFLPIAGPMGTAVGMAIGAAVMLVIGVNYHYMMNYYPDAGGTYSYAKHVLGYDHGYLSAWFLVLVYIAIIWANATALPLIFRNLLGGVFQFGFHYQIAGYDIYFGEILVTLAAIWIFGLVCICGGRFAAGVQTVMAIILFGGVFLIFIVTAKNYDGNIFHIVPSFYPEKAPTSAIFNIMALAPWAFVGFESISHSTQEFKFSPRKSLPIMLVAVIAAGLAYIFLAVIAAAVVPEGYESWVAYINDIGNLPGIEGLPTFHAVDTLMGKTGLVILCVTVIGGIVTGLVGNYIAASRLIYSMARDELLPQWFGKLNGTKTPKNALLFVMLLSLPVPFLGRAAIGWIIDVNTIGATIAYAYTSVAAFKRAKDTRNTPVQITGLIGPAISALFFLYCMVPNFWAVSAMSTESYLILITWSILGFVFFRYIFQKDARRRLGKSTVVWIVLLFLIFFTSIMWVRETTHDTTGEVLSDLYYYSDRELEQHGVELNDWEKADSEFYLEQRMELVNDSLTRSTIIQMALIALALFIMFNIYNSMMQREKDMEVQKVQAEQSNKAKSDFLSNMSHDIRTPMNAIIGFTNLAIQNPEDTDRVREYLAKIQASSNHLLSLINDVLEMSRIESGRIELEETEVSLPEVLRDLNTIIIGQVESKRQELFMDAVNVTDEIIFCDKLRLNQVLLNLLSNAIKYTPEGGQISVRVSQKDDAPEGCGAYEIRVKDNGIGMTPEFAEKVFEAFEREKTSTVSGIQGTGLGMAISKRIVDMMGGTIEVNTALGEGTEFIVKVNFRLKAEKMPPLHIAALEGVRALVVDDDFDSCDSITRMLNDMGLNTDWTLSGKEAIIRAKQAHERGADYRLLLVDWRLEGMSGLDVSKQLREIGGQASAIVLVTAYDWLAVEEQAREVGINGFISKPVFKSGLYNTLSRIVNNSEEVTEQEHEEVTQTVTFDGRRLLLVDDIAVNREIASMVLQMSGFEVEEACDGSEAVKKVKASNPGHFDAVLMDIQMPVMNGYDAARAIRALDDPALASIPIIAMTANAFDEDRKAALDAGMNGHVAKPIDVNQLIETLSQILPT